MLGSLGGDGFWDKSLTIPFSLPRSLSQNLELPTMGAPCSAGTGVLEARRGFVGWFVNHPVYCLSEIKPGPQVGSGWWRRGGSTTFTFWNPRPSALCSRWGTVGTVLLEHLGPKVDPGSSFGAQHGWAKAGTCKQGLTEAQE